MRLIMRTLMAPRFGLPSLLPSAFDDVVRRLVKWCASSTSAVSPSTARAPDNAFRLSARPAEGACLPPRWRSPTGWSRSERTASARTSAH